MATIAKAARRKRADGDMRRVTVGRIAKDMFNTVNPLNQRRRSGSIDDSVVPPDVRSLESKCDGYVYPEYFVFEGFQSRLPLTCWWVHKPDHAVRIGTRGILVLTLNNINTKDTQQGNIQVKQE
jgi:hypothetical protein